MLKVSVAKEEGIIKKNIFEGHAEYDDYGKDIVCASASTMLITTVNAILEFDKNAINYTNDKNIVINNLKQDNITNVLLNNLFNLLEELENNYKDYIKIIKGGGKS